MAELSIANVINISVSQPGAGLGNYNTSNLGLFTHEEPAGSFGTDGYKIYLEPAEVAVDFGTNSITYKMALAVFSQNPNIKANGGYLVIMPMAAEVQSISFSGVPASGSFVANYDGDASAAIDWDDTASEVQTKLRAIEGLEEVVVTGSMATSLEILMDGVAGDISLITTTSNTLQTSAPAAIVITVAEEEAGETLGSAITRTLGLVQYFGAMCTYVMGQVELLAAAAVLQPLKKLGFMVAAQASDVTGGGKLDLLRSGSFNHSRGLLYIGDGDTEDVDRLVMQASYAGRGLSTNFSGSNTTQNMHLKDLIGVQPDVGMTQNILNNCQSAGADCYPSIQGVPKVFASGANWFFDRIYNLLWYVGDLEVAGFNLLAQTSTKIPQTEAGVSQLKGAYRGVSEQAVTNQYAAPGEWTSPSTFGVLQDFHDNIRQRGYYIYSQPVSLQNPADREDRKAPLIQIAIKEAGAIDSSNVIVNINA